MVTKDKSNQALKSHTFDPRSGGWYYCQQTGKHLRKAQILGAIMSAINDNPDKVHLITPGAPRLNKVVKKPKKG